MKSAPCFCLYISQATAIRIISTYLEDLRARGELAGAAARLPRLLRRDEVQWEYWVRIYAEEGEILAVSAVYNNKERGTSHMETITILRFTSARMFLLLF
jgi:hypothetical protein